MRIHSVVIHTYYIYTYILISALHIYLLVNMFHVLHGDLNLATRIHSVVIHTYIHTYIHKCSLCQPTGFRLELSDMIIFNVINYTSRPVEVSGT
jgi:hypothetical protein